MTPSSWFSERATFTEALIVGSAVIIVASFVSCLIGLLVEKLLCLTMEQMYAWLAMWVATVLFVYWYERLARKFFQ